MLLSLAGNQVSLHTFIFTVRPLQESDNITHIHRAIFKSLVRLCHHLQQEPQGPENYYNLFKPEGYWSNKCKWWRHIIHHTDILSKVDAHSGTHVDLASQLQLSLPALNTQVKKKISNWQKLHPLWASPKATKITEGFAAEESEMCS